MSMNREIYCKAGVWTELTNANTTAVCVHNPSGFDVKLQGTFGPNPPTASTAYKTLKSLDTLNGSTLLVDLWPYVQGGPANRLYANPPSSVTLTVSHADA